MKIDHATGRTLLDYFAGRREEILSLTRAVVEVESPSGDSEGSREVVGLLARAAEKIEAFAPAERIAAGEDFGDHLRLRAFGGEGAEKTILLVGHTDTVHARGSLRERPWREEGGRLYGPGVFDTKANCVLALEAVGACRGLGLKPSKPVVVLLTCDEEVGSFTGRALVEEEARRAEAVLVLEPSAPGGRAKTARKGTGGYTLDVRGVAAHAGLDPEKGASAILELARQIERLHALSDPATGTTVNVGVVEGGTRSNVVAAHARAEIDVRFATSLEAARLDQIIRGLQPFDPRVSLRIEGGVNRPPLERTEGVARLYEHARGVAAALDFELGETSVGGASDGNFAAVVGAPVLDGLGVEGGGAHADHEHIVADDLPRRAALLAALIASL